PLPNVGLEVSPKSFGFDSNPTGEIKIENGNLIFSNGGNVNVIGGSVTANNGSVNVSGSGNLRVYGRGTTEGTVSLTGDLPAGSGDITVTNSQLKITDGGSAQISGRSIQISSESLSTAGSVSTIASSSNNAGTITVNAESLIIDGGSLGNTTGIYSSAPTLGSNSGTGNINITVTGDIKILNGGLIGSFPYDEGDGGVVTVTAGSLIINNSDIVSQSFNIANAGDIAVNVTGLLQILNNGKIYSMSQDDTVEIATAGDAGSVTVKTESLEINSGYIGSYTEVINANAGNTGNVTVNVTGDATISGVNSTIASNGVNVAIGTFSKGSGNAGSVTMDVGGTLTLVNTGILTTATSGSGGAIHIGQTKKPTQMTVENSNITTSTNSSTAGGEIRISAGDLTIDGQGNQKGIRTSTSAGGQAGDIIVNTSGAIQIVNTGYVVSQTSSSGSTGSITITAHDLTIDPQGNTDGGTEISTEAESGSTGVAGDINVTLTGGTTEVIGDGSNSSTGAISSRTYGSGQAGNIILDITGNLAIDGSYVEGYSEGSSGNTGNVEITVSDVMVVKNSGKIGTTSSSSGNAGNTTVKVTNTLQLLSGGKIGSVSDFQEGTPGNAGNVTVSAGSLEMDTGFIGSALLSSGTANTGNVAITVTGDTTVTNVDSFISGLGFNGAIGTYNKGSGNARSVTMEIGGTLTLVDTGIQTQATSGSGGSVSISAGAIDITDSDNLTFTNTSLSTTTGAIAVKVDDTFTLTNSNIYSTTGSILIDETGAVILNNSDITT
ncbi:hypothetical protein TI05_13425, partial [Achromatium sp. WMS3]